MSDEDRDDRKNSKFANSFEYDPVSRRAKPAITLHVVTLLCEYVGIQDDFWSLDPEAYGFL